METVNILLEKMLVWEACRQLDDQDSQQRLLWSDHCLALIAENELGKKATGFPINSQQREIWASLCYGPSGYYEPFQEQTGSHYYHYFWILSGDRIAGIFSIPKRRYSYGIEILSLYVRPEFRQQGLASHVMEHLFTLACEAGFGGLIFRANWRWKQPLGYYLRRRYWVRHWKHELHFGRFIDQLPYGVSFSGDHAQFSMAFADRWECLIRAERLNAQLGWEETPFARDFFAADNCIKDDVYSTFSVHLAHANWPLIRNPDEWESRRFYSEGGSPEGLAEAIRRWECRSSPVTVGDE